MKKIIILATFMLTTVLSMPLFGAFQSSTVNGNIIVTDTETGLIWQKTYESGKNWQWALNYCENLTYAGYNDWRLPNKNELISLVNYEKKSPASDFPDMPGEYFWSSTSNIYLYADNSWSVDFSYGDVSSRYKNNSQGNSVRCVRNAD